MPLSPSPIAATLLKAVEHDGIVVYGRREQPVAVRTAQGLLHHIKNAFDQATSIVSERSNAVPPVAITAKPERNYLGQASTLSIAGMACIHRTPIRD